jgi:branched-chain amino acid transport system ATP-binding protein
MALLELQKLTKSFGGVTAVNQLDLTVEKGEILGLIGPNGAGKTTVFNMITGVLTPTKGKVLFKGKNIIGKGAHSIAKMGLIRTFQITAVFGDLTVIENIRLGFHLSAGIGFFADILNTPATKRRERELADKAKELADLMGIGEKRDELAKNLSHGQQRSLELAIAMASGPELLMLDEPVAGMSSEETKDVMQKIRKMHERGLTVLLIEHDMKMVMDLCPRIFVLNFGQKLTEGTPSMVCSNEEVISAYLGTEYAS